MALKYFYICGTGKISNTIINWLISRRTKKKTINKSNRIRRKTNAVKKFKPKYSFSISIKSCKHIFLLNLPNLFVNTLGRSDSLSKKYINMDCRYHVVKVTGEIHKSKLFRASLNATDKLGSLKKIHCVNDNLTLMPLNVEHRRFQDQIHFKSPDKAKEYLWINYLIINEYQVIAGM